MENYSKAQRAIDKAQNCGNCKDKKTNKADCKTENKGC